MWQQKQITASNILTVYKVDVLCISYISFETVCATVCLLGQGVLGPQVETQRLPIPIPDCLPHHLTLTSSLGHIIGKERHSSPTQPLILHTEVSQYLALSSKLPNC
jgi:hypothetical protein